MSPLGCACTAHFTDSHIPVPNANTGTAWHFSHSNHTRKRSYSPTVALFATLTLGAKISHHYRHQPIMLLSMRQAHHGRRSTKSSDLFIRNSEDDLYPTPVPRTWSVSTCPPSFGTMTSSVSSASGFFIMSCLNYIHLKICLTAKHPATSPPTNADKIFSAVIGSPHTLNAWTIKTLGFSNWYPLTITRAIRITLSRLAAWTRLPHGRV